MRQLVLNIQIITILLINGILLSPQIPIIQYSYNFDKSLFTNKIIDSKFLSSKLQQFVIDYVVCKDSKVNRETIQRDYKSKVYNTNGNF